MPKSENNWLDDYMELFRADPVEDHVEYYSKGCAYFILTPLLLVAALLPGVLVLAALVLLSKLLGVG